MKGEGMGTSDGESLGHPCMGQINVHPGMRAPHIWGAFPSGEEEKGMNRPRVLVHAW